MHPLRYALMAGISRAALSPSDDQGAEFDDVDTGTGDDFDEDAGDDDLDTDVNDELDEDEEEQDDEPQQRQRQPSRGQQRIEALAREKTQLEERIRTLEQGNQTQRQEPRETPQQREARLNALPEGQRAIVIANETAAQTQHALNELRFQQWDNGDQAAFDRLAATSPAVKKLADKVETELKAMRANGQNAPRANIAKYLLGEMALQGQGRAQTRGARRAADGQARQTTRPASTRSDAQADRTRGGNGLSALEKRLEGKLI